MIKPMLVASALLILGLSAQETDNTKTNQRDRAAGAITADQQKMNAADRELARKIRKSVVDDKSLSTYAHNVKIIARDGSPIRRGIRDRKAAPAKEPSEQEVMFEGFSVVR